MSLSGNRTTIEWPFADPERIVVAGDWHGNDHAAKRAFTFARDQGADLILQLGDFGLWPGYEGAAYLGHITHAVNTSNVPLAWIDGNHEDFDQLYRTPVDPVSGLRSFGEQFWHLPRASRWTWHGHVWAALGGATSLDRPHRTPGASWWPQEAVTAQDRAQIESGGRVDVLVCHDCPSGVNIPGIVHRDPIPSRFWPQADLELAWEHRDRLADTVAVLQPSHLFHGHFHVHHDQTINLPDTPSHEAGRQCRVVGLADDSGTTGNLALVDVRTLDVLMLA